MRKSIFFIFFSLILALSQPLTPVLAAGKPASAKAAADKSSDFKSSMDKRAADAVSALLAAYAKKDACSDWAAYGLLINGVAPPKSYFTALDKKIKDAKGNFRAVTDYARLTLVYQAAGKDPAKAAGYNLIKKICSFENVSKQGLNGPIWALLALNGKSLPKNAKWNISLLVDEILKFQPPGQKGGFSLASGKKAAPDVDMTCMAVTALSSVRDALKDDARIPKAVGSALGYLADNEEKVKKTSESVSQYVIALCAAGSCEAAAVWIETLLGWQLADGTFAHEKGGKSDNMATEQALLALTAYVKGGSVF